MSRYQESGVDLLLPFTSQVPREPSWARGQPDKSRTDLHDKLKKTKKSVLPCKRTPHAGHAGDQKHTVKLGQAQTLNKQTTTRNPHDEASHRQRDTLLRRSHSQPSGPEDKRWRLSLGTKWSPGCNPPPDGARGRSGELPDGIGDHRRG